MPAVTLEDPYPLAHFTTTTSTALSNDTLAVSCTPVDVSPLSSVISDSASTTDSDLVALTVQGEGVDLYNRKRGSSIATSCLSKEVHLKELQLPDARVFNNHNLIEFPNAQRTNPTIVVLGSDVSPKEESKIVWMWHDKDDKGLSLDAESEAGLATKTVKKVGLGCILVGHALGVNDECEDLFPASIPSPAVIHRSDQPRRLHIFGSP
ncbi:hypothetical protein BC936DRAFT_147350 [Jimgerdemannia flammicorona]|uniref:Uncharacterized protein n=1 Tax=Jimgerdemannia flammicorona TaxID=994334 RepID=A0A433D5K3_9FUNG|nr:hypothetical protein BC936DRAFT_147350 [Jimgerdemannia flammicorona]